MPTTSNFGWTTPADTDLVKDGAAAIRTLGNGIDTSLLDLKGGTSGQVLSKNSNTDLDYTWVTPNVGDITEVQAGTGISVASGTGPIPVVTNSMATEITAKGDLIVGTGSGTFDNLPAGTNGDTLVADSSTATGLKWAAPSSGALKLINRSTFSNVASHTIDSVFSSTYKSYLVSIEYLYSATAADDLLLRFRYGSSTEAGSSYYANAINAVYSSASVSNYASSGTTSMALTSTAGDSGNPCAGLLEFNLVGNASEVPLVTGNILDAQEIRVFNVGGGTITAQTYTGFQLFAASGNITGAVSVYGLVTS